LPSAGPVRPHELAHGLSTGIDKRQAERFRRGKTPIEGRIDLHGRTQQQAHDDLRAFLTRAHAAGKRCVLVITGKGMTAAKPGVLRQNVPRWLNEPGLRRHVLAFDYAERQHGGEGALYVLLKREREKTS
jgi:DNA-nicking Smr family endonuclease